MAAAAIWVQCEQALSAAQSGWIQVTSSAPTRRPTPPPALHSHPQHLSCPHASCRVRVPVRTLALLGKRDAGAPTAFYLLILFASLLVAVYNGALYLASPWITSVVSNDPAVPPPVEDGAVGRA